MVLIGDALLAGFGSQGAQAAGNPFNEILAKLDQILTALGGLSQGNHTLRWDQVPPAAQRFVVLAAFNNAAVLDKETGLVWEQSPATTTHDWVNARLQCTSSTTGGRKGWRLPSVHEQASLIDPSVSSPGLMLPPGHPFPNVQSSALSSYWSATTHAVSPALAWVEAFGIGFVNAFDKPSTRHVWCVRSGMQESVY